MRFSSKAYRTYLKSIGPIIDFPDFSSKMCPPGKAVCAVALYFYRSLYIVK